jgi:DNA-directed RNA polymerase delta subunit
MAKKLKKEELELMSYNDIANILLKDKQKQSTLDLFTKIVEMLELPKSTLENKIGEFYTALTSDKRFIMLEDGSWDLQQNHKAKNILSDEDLEDYDEDTEDYDDEEPEKEEEMYDSTDSDDDISDITEEYKNLVIVDEDELGQEQ